LCDREQRNLYHYYHFGKEAIKTVAPGGESLRYYFYIDYYVLLVGIICQSSINNGDLHFTRNMVLLEFFLRNNIYHPYTIGL
jgi:hypothetical protein